jgi:outer membrane protein, heavy metal efflux system
MKKPVLCAVALMIIIGQSIAEELTLNDVLQKTVNNNLELAGFQWDNQALELESLSLAMRPNPELGLEFENLGNSSNIETSLKISQLIELGGKRKNRASVAEHLRLINNCDQNIIIRELLTSTRKSFINVLTAEKQLSLAGEYSKVANSVLNEVTRRVESGSASVIEKHRAKVEFETALIDKNKAEQQLLSAKTELASKWNRISVDFTLVGNLEELPNHPSLIINNNPMLDKQSALQEYQRQTVNMENSLSIPDLKASSGLKRFHDTHETAFMIEFEMPIQLFNSNREKTEAAEAKVRSSDVNKKAVHSALQTKLEVLLQDLLATTVEIEKLANTILPEAEKAFEFSQSAWQRGALSFTDVLYSEQLLFDLKFRYNSALKNYHFIVIDINHITGKAQ